MGLRRQAPIRSQRTTPDGIWVSAAQPDRQINARTLSLFIAGVRPG